MTLAPTSNMNLQKAEPGVTPGPNWAQLLNDIVDALDSHDHSSGKGRRITTSGLNINAALEFNNNQATELNGALFTNLSELLADNNAVYVRDGNLYFNDNSGANVQITSGGAVASAISGAFATKVPSSYPYTVVAGDAQRVLLVDTSTTRTINLPAATTAMLFMVKDTGGLAGVNPITVVPSGSDQIDGSSSNRLLSDNRGWWTFISDGVNRWSIGTQHDVAVPVGAMHMFGGGTVPAGYLFCNGNAVSRTTYARLFAILGTAYGAGDGSTTFNLPDLRQKFPLGKSASGVGVNLGDAGGNITQTATVPKHHHGMGAGATLAISSSGAHTHTIDHDHGAGSTNSAGAHVHDISHGHSASSASAGGHFHHMMVDTSVSSGGSPSGTDKGFVRSFDAVNDFSYDLKTNNVEPDSARTSEVAGHTHTITVNGFSGNSASAGAHSHTATVPAHSGSSGSTAHTHGSGNFTGAIGEVTGGQDGNTDMPATVSSAPYLTVNYIIKF
jgi:microcystin-dependent protein